MGRNCVPITHRFSEGNAAVATSKSSPVLATGRQSSVSAHPRRRSWWRSDMLIAFLIITPSIIAVAIFIYGFIAWTTYMSTVKWNSQIPDYTFVGLKNWIRLFGDNRFRIDLRNLVYYATGFMSQCIIFGFIIAALLDQKIKGEAIFRTIVIFPFAVSGIVTGVAWRWLMQACADSSATVVGRPCRPT